MLAHMLHPMPMMAPHMLHDVLHCAVHMQDRRLSVVEPHVTESEDTFTVEAHAPGVAAADVKIEFDSESNSVRIKGSTSSSAHTHFIEFTTAFGHRAVDASHAAEQAVSFRRGLTISQSCRRAHVLREGGARRRRPGDSGLAPPPLLGLLGLPRYHRYG